VLTQRQQCFICAKVQWQQQQSAQSERKSTARYGDEPIFWKQKNRTFNSKLD